MAITTIPWGDGSGDNIYLSAPSQTGDQSVSVTSDPNTGAARSKVVTFSASGVSPVSLTINQDAWRRLPLGYTELEYVITDSKAYLDTGVSGNNNNLIVNITFMTTRFVMYGYIYGNYNTNDNYNIHRVMYDSSNARFLVNHNTKGGGSSYRTYQTNVKNEMTITHSGFTRNGTSYALSSTANGNTNTRNICLGAQYVGTSVVRDVGLRVYSFSIYDGDTSLIDLIPCVRDLDSVAGFYDLVSNVFRPSDTSTDFIAGPTI